MSPAARVRFLAGGAAVAAAALVVGVVLLTGQDPPQPKAQCAKAPTPFIVPGIGKPAAAAAVRAAYAHWPLGTLDRFEQLATEYPGNPVVQFNYGVALDCRGYLNDAAQALTAAKRSGRDTIYEIDADQLLHPEFFQSGYPLFAPISHNALLVRGAVLQREGHQHSAERLYAEAAKQMPNDPEALVAAAVGRFDEDNLNASFSRLGPLAKRFPRNQEVHYYLGLLLVWIGQGDEAIAQFKQAKALGATTAIGRETATLLNRIAAAGSASTGK